MLGAVAAEAVEVPAAASPAARTVTRRARVVIGGTVRNSSVRIRGTGATDDALALPACRNAPTRSASDDHRTILTGPDLLHLDE
jgi:hypothetical protein